MAYALDVSARADAIFFKLAKKDPLALVILTKKLPKILQDPHHFKPLRGDMHGERRVHFGSFVLTYEIDEPRKIVRLLDYDHHDHIYG